MTIRAWSNVYHKLSGSDHMHYHDAPWLSMNRHQTTQTLELIDGDVQHANTSVDGSELGAHDYISDKHQQ